MAYALIASLLSVVSAWSYEVNAFTGNQTTGTRFDVVQNKMAIGIILEEQLAKRIQTCALGCNDNPFCQSANALHLSANHFKCQFLQKRFEPQKLEYSANSTHLSPQLDSNSIPFDNSRDGGGWLMIQRRTDGSVDFYRNWESYKHGFGMLNGEFWLGLAKIHQLVKGGRHTLRFDFWHSLQGTFYAKYKHVTIADEADKYRINWDTFEGTGGDNLVSNRGMQFTTFDEDNDVDVTQNCAIRSKGAWWHEACSAANPNGEYGSNAWAEGTYMARSGGYGKSFTFEIKIKIES